MTGIPSVNADGIFVAFIGVMWYLMDSAVYKPPRWAILLGSNPCALTANRYA